MKAKTWFGRFLQVTKENYPHIITGVEIDVVKGVTADIKLTNEQISIKACSALDH